MAGTALQRRKQEENKYLKRDKEESQSGSQLYKCPFTGFLGFIPPQSPQGGITPIEKLLAYQNGGTDPFIGFAPRKKVAFIEVLRKHWPNLTKALKEIDGPDRNTLQAHMGTDAAFMLEIKAIEREMMDELKSDIKRMAKKPKNFMDRMALGRLYAPEEFDPARRLIVENRKSVDTKAIQNRLQAAESFIDAELVQTPVIDKPTSSNETSSNT